MQIQEAYSEWSSKRFVGILSYQSDLKIQAEGMGLIDIIDHYTSLYNEVDVIALLSPRGLTLRTQAQRTHGILFVEIFHEVLRRLGFNEDAIFAADNVEAFFCNYWLAKPALMAEYIEFLSRAVQLMETDPVLSFLLSADARYPEGHIEVAQNAFGTPFYQLHPFIGERLPVFFFWARKSCLLRVRTRFRDDHST